MEAHSEQYNELALYTLQLRDAEFIHQYIVDAYAAQHADEKTKPITLTFALMGLYLHLEKNYTGKAIQDFHKEFADKIKGEKVNNATKTGTLYTWPVFVFPPQNERGTITAKDVLDAPAGPERDEMIKKWSASVWDAWKGNGNREKIIGLF